MLLFSCSSLQHSTSSLVGTQWRLSAIESMGGRQFHPQESAHYTLQFLADRRLLVQADCNHGIGTWMQDGAAVRIGPVGMSRVYCGPESLDARFLRDLDEVRSLEMRRGSLFLTTLADAATLEFAIMEGFSNAEQAFEYECEHSGTIAVRFENQRTPSAAILRIGPQRLPLLQVVSASGARYQNAGYEFWDKGGIAQLTSPRGTETCQQ